MNEKLFREIESRYYDVKAKADLGEISPDQYKAELKKLMLQDESGRYWMIGGKSGGWYVYENNSWQASSPYSFNEESQDEGGATEAEYMAGSGSETDSYQAGDDSLSEGSDTSFQSSYEDSYGSAYAPAADTSYESADESYGESSQDFSSRESSGEVSSYQETRKPSRQKEASRYGSAESSMQDTRPREKTAPCRFCGSQIPSYSQYCPHCGGNQKAKTTRPGQTGVSLRDGEMVLRSLNLISLFILFGLFGVFFGLVAGATFGIFKIGGDIIYRFPQMMQDAHGKAQGGFIFGALGGLSGGILFGFLGALFGLLFNTAAIFMKARGVRIKIKT